MHEAIDILLQIKAISSTINGRLNFEKQGFEHILKQGEEHGNCKNR